MEEDAPKRASRASMPARLRQFIAEMAIDGNVVRAARTAGLGRATVYDRRFVDPAFAESWRTAELEAAANIEAEIYRRGHAGWDETRTDGQGRVTSSVRRFSDACLLALARARVPGFVDRHEVKVSHELTAAQIDEIRASVARERPEPLPRVTAADLANAPETVEAFLERIVERRRASAEACESGDGE